MTPSSARRRTKARKRSSTFFWAFGESRAWCAGSRGRPARAPTPLAGRVDRLDGAARPPGEVAALAGVARQFAQAIAETVVV
jgi:hypothetical protein